MSNHDLALVFYGFGGIAVLFTLVRTYWQVWKIKKETSRAVRPGRSSKPPSESSDRSV